MRLSRTTKTSLLAALFTLGAIAAAFPSVSASVPPCIQALGCPPDIWCNQIYCIHDPPCTRLLGCPPDPWCNPTYCTCIWDCICWQCICWDCIEPCTALLGCPPDPWCNPTWCFYPIWTATTPTDGTPPPVSTPLLA